MAESGSEMVDLIGSFAAISPVPIVIVDPSGTVELTNPAVAQLLQLNPAAADHLDRPSRKLADLLPVQAEQLTALINEAVKRNRGLGPFDLRGSGDGLRHWKVAAFAIRAVTGLPAQVGLIFLEVTEEVVAAHRLRDLLVRLEASLTVSRMGTWELDMTSGDIGWSPEMAAMTGINQGELQQGLMFWLSNLHEDDRQSVVTGLSGATVGQDIDLIVRWIGSPPQTKWLQLYAKAIGADDGTIARLVGVAQDVTERHVRDEIRAQLLQREHEARVAAEAATQRFSLLAEAGTALASATDPHEIAEIVAQLLVPRLGDWCNVQMLSEEGEISSAVVVHKDQDLQNRTVALADPDLEDGTEIWSVRRSMRNGRSERVEAITSADLEDESYSPEHRELLQLLRPTTAMAVPLISRGRVLGGMSVVRGGTASYNDDDQAFFERLSSRVSAALDMALLFQSRAAVTRALQQTLLPPELPSIEGLDIATEYRVAEAGIQIGGDFYDLISLGDRWAAVIGDVCGKGPEAAGVTGVFRHTLRAVAGSDSVRSAADLLRATNDAILNQIDDSRFASAVAIGLERSPGGFKAQVACAGHPRPLVLSSDGQVTRVDASGTLLGIVEDPNLTELEVLLRPGDSMILYTDGVSEARNGSDQFGEIGIVECLTTLGSGHPAKATSSAIIRSVDEFRSSDSHADDAAVMVIKVPEEEESSA